MDVYADLRVEKENEIGISRILVIEIKGFKGPSPILHLEQAIGQYRIYRTYLKILAPEILKVSTGKLFKITLQETHKNYVEYFGE